MICVSLSLLLLEISFGSSLNDDKGAFFRPPRHRIVRDLASQIPLANQIPFGQKGNYVTTVIFVDLPKFSDVTDVGDVNGISADKFKIQYSNVKFYQLSSAYAYSYKIDLDAQSVQLKLLLGKAKITGSYSLSTPLAPNIASQDFETNLYADLIFTYNILFQVDENGKATFGKTENHRLLHKKVKGKYANPPSALAADLKNYLSPKLLEAVIAKLYDEVHDKIKLDEVGYQIKNEIAFRKRNQIADRLKTSITEAFDDVHENAFNVFYHDKTNFNRIIQNYEVRIPTFLLRDIDGFRHNAVNITFAGDDVNARSTFTVDSPLGMFRAVYRKLDDPQAENKTVKVEYHLFNLDYGFELTAKPETETVELNKATAKTSSVSVASIQGRYGDERDIIIQELKPYIQAYAEANAQHAFAQYIKGLVDEGRIAYKVFK